MADAIFEEPRLAAIYDAIDGNRADVDAYLAMVGEHGVRSVLDVGCGTGTFACLLASHGVDVIAVDPAVASIDVARRKPHADQVRWLVGNAMTLPPLAVDLATMTGNVAQVFLSDEEWLATLDGPAKHSGQVVDWCSRRATRRGRHGASGPASNRSDASRFRATVSWRPGRA